MSAQFMNMLQNMAPRSNRPLTDLRTSTDPLNGMDAMELRGWASQNPMVPLRDLTDPLGKALLARFMGEDEALHHYLQSRIEEHGKQFVVNELYTARWGPTKIPLYNVLLPFFIHTPSKREALLGLTKYLAHDLGVPVNGTDVTGASALYWSISTKPHAEPAFAQILFDAGGDVNQKNRFGGTVASEIAQADLTGDTSRNVGMLAWYIEHGGDIDVKDNDGMNVRMLVEMMQKRVPGMAEVVRKGRGARRDGECENCGRKKGEGKGFASCSRCKKVRYCTQGCQKVDWKAHKKTCMAG